MALLHEQLAPFSKHKGGVGPHARISRCNSAVDIMFEMPPSIKSVPTNEWVWKLRERLESAHTYVRQTTGESMNRQKRVRDRRQFYEVFKPGDNVYVFFPVKRVGHSSKLTSYWRGPYEVLGKLSDVLYKVNCGRDRAPLIIHCDRMKAARSQVLLGEELQTVGRQSHQRYKVWTL